MAVHHSCSTEKVCPKRNYSQPTFTPKIGSKFKILSQYCNKTPPPPTRPQCVCVGGGGADRPTQKEGKRFSSPTELQSLGEGGMMQKTGEKGGLVLGRAGGTTQVIHRACCK